MNNLQRISYLYKTVLNHNVHRNILSACSGIIIRDYASSPTITIKAEPQLQPKSLLSRLLYKVPFFSVSKYRLKVTGYLLFESIVDGVNYLDIFKKFNLPDTFYSWFVITELYIWMVMVRYMAEGKDGRQVRNCILEALWGDCRHRVKKLGAVNPSDVRMQIVELSEQLNATLISYDEGLQTSDVVLANAIWRRIFQQEAVDPEHLDALVKYIRRQVKLLDGMTKDQLFEERNIKWEPIQM